MARMRGAVYQHAHDMNRHILLIAVREFTDRHDASGNALCTLSNFLLADY